MEEAKAKAIKALTVLDFDDLLPLPYFQKYAKKFGGDLSDDDSYYNPIYPAFEDFNLKYNTSTIDPILLNDFDFCVDEDRDKLSELIRMDFDGDTFETVASCSCKKTTGNWRLGSGRPCIYCGGVVERLTETSMETKVWLRKPTGVSTFINPALFRTLLRKITTKNPKIEIVTFIIDSGYRKADNKKNTEGGVKLVNALHELGVWPGINEFHKHSDSIMEYFLVGAGRSLTNLNNLVGEKYLNFYYKYKHLVFCDFIPIPNKLSTIIERNGKDNYASKLQIEISSIYQSIADTKDDGEFDKATEFDIAESVDIVGRAIGRLAIKQTVNTQEYLIKKKGISRKHIAAGSLPFTARSIATSITGIHDTSFVVVPWVMAIAVLKEHILSFLYRQGYSPRYARELIVKSAYEIVPIIDGFFKHHENERNLVSVIGRTPSIEHLSRKTMFCTINRDLEDLSIKMPILSCSELNLDFDGDQLYLFFLLDLESKAKAYGGFGHHQMLDENKLFKVSRHANQSSTNMINLNSVVHTARKG